jgi:hypothetical protein
MNQSNTQIAGWKDKNDVMGADLLEYMGVV